VGTTLSPSNAENASVSKAAQWHRERRRQMLEKYGDQIAPLERKSSSQNVALPLLAFANLSLVMMSLWSKFLSPSQVFLLALFPGSMFSLWQLQILHDCLHGSLLVKGKNTAFGVQKKKLQDRMLFWGSMPSAFGYYLYLKYGHLTHHKNVGDENSASLATLFASDNKDFEDGDVLFVAHRMKLKGEIGPKFTLPSLRKGGTSKEIKMSISKSGFNLWKVGRPVRNAMAFAASFMYERMMLVVNDLVVAISGKNFFFPNKPKEFHRECALYCRCAVAVRIMLWKLAGWKSLLFLYLAETLWSIPPHPACAMFVTNHGSKTDPETGTCIPSSSTYSGKWYSVFTLGTNYHCEHHDFPTIPFQKLGDLRNIAPEFYRQGSKDNLVSIMDGAFSDPDFYACLDAGVI
jgi:fatty acid desaturase